MKFIKYFNSLNENIENKYLEYFFSCFTDLSDDGYQIEFRNSFGTTCKFSDYAQRNQNWQKFSNTIYSASIKQVMVLIETLNNDYDGYSKLIDDMRPVVVEIDDLDWQFIKFSNTMKEMEFTGAFYTFENREKSNRPKSISDDEITQFINNRGFWVVSIERLDDPDWDGEVIRVQMGSQGYSGLIPSNIDDILNGFSTALGFESYSIDGQTNYTVWVLFYL